MNEFETNQMQGELFADQDKPVDTWNSLQHLGFIKEDDHIGCPSMSYDFGSFKLRATKMVNLYLREVVSFFGVLRTPNTITPFEFEMPLHVESEEQCAAWIAWHIHHNLPHREKLFLPSRCELLIFGLQHQATLPWERERLVREREAAEYRARRSCPRTWCKSRSGSHGLRHGWHASQTVTADRLMVGLSPTSAKVSSVM